MANYFEILGIDINSDEKEIKRAYVKKVREFPPEKDAQKYNEIREAYETLSKENQRIQYKTYLEYGEEINNLDIISDEAVDCGDYEKAIIQLKKILLIEYRLPFIQNKLALAFIYNKQYDEGIKILKRLVDDYSEDVTYISNLAYGLKNKGELDEAEKFCINALEIEPYEEKTLELLMSIYIEKSEIERALEYLKISISKHKSQEFREFIYYYEFLRVATLQETSENVSLGIKLLMEALPENEEDKYFVVSKLSNLAEELYEVCYFTDSSIILEEILKVDEDVYLKSLYDETKKFASLVKISKKFEGDSRICKNLKSLIIYYFAKFRMAYNNYNDNINKITKELQFYKNNNEKNFMEEIKIIKNEYNELYNLKKSYFLRMEN